MTRILLIVGGGIAAYKCLELIRRAREAGLSVRVVMSEAATRFVTPLSFASLSGGKVYTDLFSLTDEAEIGHIRLSREADLVVVAPATADLMAKMANGIADSLATAVLLATDKPVLMAPAMNPRMWSHPATQRNVARLRQDGIAVVGPNAGEMAEANEAGEGRMAEPAEILAAIRQRLAASAASAVLAGIRMLVTSGPTHEPIDPVRYLANRSSGKQGHAIAAAAAAAGADVTLVSGPVSLPDPPGVRTVHVETARQMLAAVEERLPVDVAVCAAAVADWRPEAEGSQKLKKDGSGAIPQLRLTENPDILQTLSQHHTLRPRLVVGFAAETETVIEHARAKLARKGCDLIVANDVSAASGVMGGDRNRVHLVSPEGVETWAEMAKTEVASRLVAHIGERLKAAAR
ncbi:phosphopantothenoylcysteine decarboxylase/phosphopantothenate--cysteine ligase [Tepidamorphus gemmatus]|jgi:phosphopantothenoylcysteine decarboxylase/phosphopantothenate--cysteine ligase|uniref:Coenzyme A biosynthesis bifunctional protein CoaBC n=1 Tax=Tepidamorphus gemmatus TaxID=747076 RepID=A0A4R3MFX2_9HYPH|nr:bifunctional phosphopantothenoylcysteine decarboxylase/phosphopantothenate--cysteine ligase CoaBC [Tepidamorphus gemmatus]TCT12003.1 phosphopantothenoylcysteine decarboxylase/phosphopantothenate--cysteine ligase [Tepidamorphus gemmatus]